MFQRINPYEIGFKTIRPLFAIGAYMRKTTVEQPLLHLITLRISQINGCAYCIDMHTKDLLAMGETAPRLLVLDAWRESGLYSERERAALEFAEAVNKVGPNGVPDAVFEQAAAHFADEELIDLVVSVIGTSSYNRINIAFCAEAGSYVPGQHDALVS